MRCWRSKKWTRSVGLLALGELQFPLSLSTITPAVRHDILCNICWNVREIFKPNRGNSYAHILTERTSKIQSTMPSMPFRRLKKARRLFRGPNHSKSMVPSSSKITSKTRRQSIDPLVRALTVGLVGCSECPREAEENAKDNDEHIICTNKPVGHSRNYNLVAIETCDL